MQGEQLRRGLSCDYTHVFTRVVHALPLQVEQLHRDLHVLDARRKVQLRELEEVKRDLDIVMASFLSEEADGKDKVALFQVGWGWGCGWVGGVEYCCGFSGALGQMKG